MRFGRDIERAHEVIRDLELQGPHDDGKTFRWPKADSGRKDLADLIYDMDDQYAARAVLDAPTRTVTQLRKK